MCVPANRSSGSSSNSRSCLGPLELVPMSSAGKLAGPDCTHIYTYMSAHWDLSSLFDKSYKVFPSPVSLYLKLEFLQTAKIVDLLKQTPTRTARSRRSRGRQPRSCVNTWRGNPCRRLKIADTQRNVSPNVNVSKNKSVSNKKLVSRQKIQNVK